MVNLIIKAIDRIADFVLYWRRVRQFMKLLNKGEHIVVISANTRALVNQANGQDYGAKRWLIDIKEGAANKIIWDTAQTLGPDKINADFEMYRLAVQMSDKGVDICLN
jgi:hypothetical protein